MSHATYTEEELSKVAADENCTLLIAGPHDLFVDLDGDSVLNKNVLARLRMNCEVVEVGRWTSRSGGGTHVHLRTDGNFSFVERLLLQAALGSDPLREILPLFEEPNRQFSALLRPIAAEVTK